MAAFDDTGQRGRMVLIEYATVAGAPVATVVAHYSATTRPPDRRHLAEDWELHEYATDQRRPLTASISHPYADAPFAYVAVRVGPRPRGVLVWRSKTLATYDDFSVTLSGRPRARPPTPGPLQGPDHCHCLLALVIILLVFLVLLTGAALRGHP